MEKKELIFKPKRGALFKRSPFCVFSLIAKSILLCTEYLIKTASSKNIIKLTDEYTQRFWRLHFATSKTSLYVSGLELLEPKETYVFMSNHGSWMDIPAMFASAPNSLRMVSKVELMKLPILGHAMYNGGFIAVDRKNRSLAIKQLEHAKELLRNGISVWIAPEGTRSRDGSLAPFKKGGFHLARDLGKSIVPIYIEGAEKVMPADTIFVYPNKSITVHFCKPVSTDGYDRHTTNLLIEKVRNAILDKKQACEQELLKLEDHNDAIK